MADHKDPDLIARLRGPNASGGLRIEAASALESQAAEIERLTKERDEAIRWRDDCEATREQEWVEKGIASLQQQNADLFIRATAAEQAQAEAQKRVGEWEGLLREAREEAQFYAEWACTPTYGYRDECVRPSMRKLVTRIDRALSPEEKEHG